MLYEKFMQTWNSQDIAGYFSCLHDDYQMIFHSTGKILSLEDFDTDQLARWMISTTRESARCLYENDDILVEHRISTYTDGERSATMLVHLKKDGLLWRTETSVTLLPPKNKSALPRQLRSTHNTPVHSQRRLFELGHLLHS
jgi:hypothetical protein